MMPSSTSRTLSVANRGVPRLVTVGVVLVAAAIVLFGFSGRTRGIEPGLYEISGKRPQRR